MPWDNHMLTCQNCYANYIAITWCWRCDLILSFHVSKVLLRAVLWCLWSKERKRKFLKTPRTLPWLAEPYLRVLGPCFPLFRCISLMTPCFLISKWYLCWLGVEILMPWWCALCQVVLKSSYYIMDMSCGEKCWVLWNDWLFGNVPWMCE